MNQIKSLLIYTPEEQRKIREYYNKTDEDVKKYVKLLLDWLTNRKNQNHMVGHINRIESNLVRNKFRIEQTKARLHKYYTYKELYREVIKYIDPKCDVIERLIFFLLGYLKRKIQPNTIQDLRRRITDECSQVTSEMLQNIRQHFEHCLYYCMEAGGEHFRHLIR